MSPSAKLKPPVGANDHVEGPAKAPVTLVEYGDYECPYCGEAYPVVKALQKRLGDQVRFVFRNFPLAEAHPHAEHAAEAAEAAGAQGKFWEMHDLLFANQDRLTPHHLRGLAERLGLDLAAFTAEMDDHVYLQRVREHQDGGRRSHVRGTPGFFVNGRIVDVSFGFERLFDAVGAALPR
jgi:protein-disulfide isomerase